MLRGRTRREAMGKEGSGAREPQGEQSRAVKARRCIRQGRFGAALPRWGL